MPSASGRVPIRLVCFIFFFPLCILCYLAVCDTLGPRELTCFEVVPCGWMGCCGERLRCSWVCCA